MGDIDIKKLMVEQTRLLKERTVAQELLKKVRETISNLEMEEILIMQKVFEDDDDTSPRSLSPMDYEQLKEKFKVFDESPPRSESSFDASYDSSDSETIRPLPAKVKKVNQQQLQLGNSPLKAMVEGRFYVEKDGKNVDDEEEEEEEEEQEVAATAVAAADDDDERVLNEILEAVDLQDLEIPAVDNRGEPVAGCSKFLN